MKSSEINDRLTNIWMRYKNMDLEIYNRKFAYSIDPIEDNAILFIGLNPSFNGDYGITQHSKRNKNSNPCVKKIESLDLDHNWSYLDLLYCKETASQKITNLSKTQLGIGFIWEQLQLTKEIIEEARPKAIVVTNAIARLLFGKDKNVSKNENTWMDYDFKLDKDIAVERIDSGALKGTPIFFTGHPRYMDISTFERFEWHLNFVINQLQKEQAITPALFKIETIKKKRTAEQVYSCFQ